MKKRLFIISTIILLTLANFSIDILKSQTIEILPSHFDISTIKKQIDAVSFPTKIINNPFDRMLETCKALFSADGLNLTAIAALSTVPDNYLDFALSAHLDKKNVTTSSYFVEVYFTYSMFSEYSKTKDKDGKENKRPVTFLSNVKITKDAVGVADERPFKMVSCIVSLVLSEDCRIISYDESYSGGGEVPSFYFRLNDNQMLEKLTIDHHRITRKLVWNNEGKLIQDHSTPYPTDPSLSKEKLNELTTLEKNFFSEYSKKKKMPIMYFDLKKIKQIKKTDSPKNEEIQTLFSLINNRNNFLIKNNLEKLTEHYLFNSSGKIRLKLIFSSKGLLSLECIQEQNDGISKGYKMEFSKEGALILYQEGSFKHFAERNFKQTLTEISFHLSGYPKTFRRLNGDRVQGDIIQWNENGELESKKENSLQNP
jgi:hypothetical protein